LSEQNYDPVRQLIDMGKAHGYLLYDEVNNMLPFLRKKSVRDELCVKIYVKR
jgi:hypothetical protein